MNGKERAMKRDEVFREKEVRRCDFEFNREVAEVFDDMLARSIPFYQEQQTMIAGLGKKFSIPGTNIYDLGCSTGVTLINMSRQLEQSRFIGYDNSLPMIEQARRKVLENGIGGDIEIRYGDFNGDLEQLRMENASIVTMCWTLQFVRPLRRDNLIKKIYQSLVDGGCLIVTEKILTNNSHMNRFFIDFYYDFKAANGYSGEEIHRKREALENVLIPYRIDENLEMFRRNGFEIVETFFQWYNFAGFLCLKKTV